MNKACLTFPTFLCLQYKSRRADEILFVFSYYEAPERDWVYLFELVSAVCLFLSGQIEVELNVRCWEFRTKFSIRSINSNGGGGNKKSGIVLEINQVGTKWNQLGSSPAMVWLHINKKDAVPAFNIHLIPRGRRFDKEWKSCVLRDADASFFIGARYTKFPLRPVARLLWFF